jgi:hypothetical protein
MKAKNNISIATTTNVDSNKNTTTKQSKRKQVTNNVQNSVDNMQSPDVNVVLKTIKRRK